jgi:dihydroflavonol-4-reductase
MKTEHTVADWSDLTNADPYIKSKTLAEKAAWEFQASLPESERFEIVTINPCLVFGPNINKAQFSSGEVIKKLMMREFPGIPKLAKGIVDVRDVAEAHL